MGNKGSLLEPYRERASLVEFLDDQREALIENLRGLSDAEAKSTPTVSALSLLGIAKHAAIWEKRWFQVIALGRAFPGEWPERGTEAPDETFQLAAHDTVESVVAEYREQIAASNAILSSVDLNTPCAMADIAEHDLRWVALHMIEETARHAGHADIIREAIDKETGHEI